MTNIIISDVTLRECAAGRESVLSFKEKLEIARVLNRLKVDVIELPAISDSKADILSNRTIASVVTGSVISAAVGYTPESVETAWESVRAANHPALHVTVPVSPVQMEYICHKKAPAVLSMVTELVSKCRYYSEQVEFSAQDATRAEKDFLVKVITAAIEAGAGRITLCDSAGQMTPAEFSAFITELYKQIPALKNVQVAVQTSDELNMAVACAAAAIESGAICVKTAIRSGAVPAMEDFVHFIQVRGNTLGIATGVRTTELTQASKQLRWILQTQKSESSPFDAGVHENLSNICLDAKDTITDVMKVVRQLGYDLTEEDNARVYEAFQRVAAKKNFVGTRELEAIVASSAMQVPTTYRLHSYVVTSGNLITSMSNITLEKDGKMIQGMSGGDGPIDASFLAIEQIIGHHYELDDFQIQSVTEGREAMGSALVKLRSNGKIYSGNGISTDIIGASVRAYINALNKIVYEEV